MSISFIGGAVGTTTATLPTHAAGDLLLAFAHRDGSTTAPSLPAGWTGIGSGGANLNSSRLAYKVAASSGETSGTWTNATGLLILVYRGTDTTTPIGGFTAGGASSLSVAYPAVTMTDTSGASWIVGVFGHRSIDINLTSAPTGMTNRASQQDATASISAFDTNGGVSAWTLQTVTHTGSSAGWRSWTVELLEAAASGVTLVIQDAAHGHTADSVALTTSTVLAIADASHGHAADNLALTTSGAVTLVVQDATHEHAADSLTLSTTSVLSIADAIHAHAADNVDLSGAPSLVIQDVRHGHSADAITLTLSTWLAINDATHAHRADNIILSLPGGLLPPVRCAGTHALAASITAGHAAAASVAASHRLAASITATVRPIP